MLCPSYDHHIKTQGSYNPVVGCIQEHMDLAACFSLQSSATAEGEGADPHGGLPVLKAFQRYDHQEWTDTGCGDLDL